MGLFDFLRSPDINSGVSQFRNTQGAVLVDVREPDEYASGHIPGSKNIPLSRLDSIAEIVTDKNAPLYVYCLSGGRSARATSMLVALGYKTVNNIGGISAYKGEVER
ncbi:MAG: rhodanese-like domain-containing protein [Clostridia bacterium]|nr:rhodanese-like domain-containing protein [Clostridia bacterium]